MRILAAKGLVPLAAIASVVILTLLVIGPIVYRGAGSTSPTPSPSPDPKATPVATDQLPPTAEADCSVIGWQEDTVAFSLKNTVMIAAEVAIARFDGLGESHWNTKDGSRPAPFSLRGSVHMYTDARFAIDSVVASNIPDASSIQVSGGKVGCDEWTYSSAPVLETGTRYVVFLTYGVAADGTKAASPTLLQAWPITDSDVVVTPLDGKMDLDTLTRLVKDGDLMKWPPSVLLLK